MCRRGSQGPSASRIWVLVRVSFGRLSRAPHEVLDLKLPLAIPLLPHIAPATEPQPEGSHRRGGPCGQQLTARSVRGVLTKGEQDFTDLGWEEGCCGRCHQGQGWVHRAEVEQRGGGVTGRAGSFLKTLLSAKGRMAERWGVCSYNGLSPRQERDGVGGSPRVWV